MSDLSPAVWSSVKDITSKDAGRPAAAPETESKQEFLRMFMAQVKNQDPMSPMEQKDMTAQLATFTALEKQIEGNKMLADIRQSLKGQETWQASSWVGKNVRVDATQLSYPGEGEVPIVYRLPEGAHNCTVRLLDDQGKLLRSFTAEEQGDNWLAAGEHAFVWDGRDHRGYRAAPNDYRIEVTAIDANGSPLSGATTQTIGKLDGVELEGGQMRLKVAGRRLRPQDVLEVL